MAPKTVNTRIQLKSDTEANWNKAGPKDGSRGFIPLLGELIIYTADGAHPFSRLKVGDGEHDVTALPFIDAGTINGSTSTGGGGNSIALYVHAADFPRSGENNKLYIDISTNKIYYYAYGIGYTQLSHFTYRPITTTIKTVKNWSAGQMTDLEVQNNILIANNGTAPQLETEDVIVITDFIENPPEVINNANNN